MAILRRKIPQEDEARRKVEAVLFAADEPLSVARIRELLGGLDARQIRRLVESLRQDYERQGRAFTIEEIAEGYQMLTRAEYATLIKDLYGTRSSRHLSAAALETLAIIAYKQPVKRTDIENIRGVDTSGVLRTLLERKLIKIAGRDEGLGRPILYGTTKKFLEFFGLRNLGDLPKLEELPAP
jgi:segregation and condensation protein B